MEPRQPALHLGELAVAATATSSSAGSAAARGYEGDALVIGLGGGCGLMLDSALQPALLGRAKRQPAAAARRRGAGSAGPGDVGSGVGSGDGRAATPGAPESDTVDFECETVEVWALPERRCLGQCRSARGACRSVLPRRKRRPAREPAVDG